MQDRVFRVAIWYVVDAFIVGVYEKDRMKLKNSGLHILMRYQLRHRTQDVQFHYGQNKIFSTVIKSTYETLMLKQFIPAISVCT